MLETARMVCSSIVQYTEQAGVVVWRKMTARPFEYTTSLAKSPTYRRQI